MADQQPDVIEILEHDHREVEQMFAELESLRGASTDEARARRKAVTDQVTIELVRHSVAEEVLVYPQVEKQGQRRGGRARARGARRSRGDAAPAGEARCRRSRLRRRAGDPDGRDPPSHRRRGGPDVHAHASGDRRGRAAQARRRASRPSRRSLPPGRTPTCRTRRCRVSAAGPAASLFDRMRDLATGRGTKD